MVKKNGRIGCVKCGSFYGYTLEDKTLVCRRCGHRDNSNKVERRYGKNGKAKD